MNKQENDRPATTETLLKAEIENAIGSTTEVPEPKRVVMTTNDQLTIDTHPYHLAVNYRDGFDVEALEERYNEILEKYDFIVGDWGYEKLRLKGFYHSDNRRASRDQVIDTLEDYLYEFCNFGCAYFVLERIGSHKTEKKNTRKRKPNKPKSRPRTKEKEKAPKAYTQSKKVVKSEVKRGNKQQAQTSRRDNPRKRHFTIRNLEDKK